MEKIQSNCKWRIELGTNAKKYSPDDVDRSARYETRGHFMRSSPQPSIKKDHRLLLTLTVICPPY